MDMRCRFLWKADRRIQNPEECPSEDGKLNRYSLQAEKTDDSPKYSFYTGIRRVFLWILNRVRVKGSLTVEAAMTVPVFLLAASTLLCALDIYRVQAKVRTSLHQSALELGMYAYAVDNGQDSPVGILSSAACAVYAKSRLPDLGKYVNVSLAGSSCENYQIKLHARIQYRFPVSILPLPSLYFTNESQVNGWVGRISEDGEDWQDGVWEEMVYVAENGSVYHTSSSCSHLDLSVHQQTLNAVNTLRNDYGGKYHSCEKCAKASGGNTIVYYTEKGDCYHTQETCSGLKRTVRLVKKSEAEGFNQCQRCKAREGS